MSETEDEPPSQSELEELGKRLKQARGDQSSPENNGGRGAAISSAFRLVTELVVGPIIGGGIGWILDSWLGTKPWFFLVFFVLGTVAGILNVMRTARQMNLTLHDNHENGWD